jgi:hypothetical protein
MDDLDKKLDAQEREKIFTLIEESSVRVGKVNVRFTRDNKKNTEEHLDALYAVFERLIRFIIKDITNIEKKIRLTYMVPLTNERKHQIIIDMNLELDRVCDHLIKKYRPFYNVIGKANAFDERVEVTRKAAKEKMQVQIENVYDSLQKETNTIKKILPQEMSVKYGLEEIFLREMHFVEPLQEMHLVFDRLIANGIDENIFKGVHDAICFCVDFHHQLEKKMPPSHDVNGRKGWRMQVAKDADNMKELVFCFRALGNQIALNAEMRNSEIIKKNWQTIIDNLSDKPESESIIANVNSYYQLLEP